jgi:hypothetical protein
MSSNIYQNTDTDKILTDNQSKNSVLLQGSKPVVVPYQRPAISETDKSLRIKIKEPDKSVPEDNIYYNIEILNQNTNLIPIDAEYDVNRVDAVLENPNLYTVTVARFQIPTSIPIFIFPDPASGVEFLINLEDRTDLNNIIESKFPVIYENFCIGCFYPRGVYHINHFLLMVNKTFQTSYDNMKLINPAYLPTQAPYITFDSATTLFTLWAEEQYLDNERFPIKISPTLNNQFFPCFMTIATFKEGESKQFKTQVQILVKDLYNNSETVNGKLLYKMIGEYSTVQLFNQMNKIEIESDSMNIDGEIQSGALPNIRRLLTDFEPPDDVSNRQYYTYNPTIYRRYNLLSTTPMTRVSCKIFINYTSGEVFPLSILYNEKVSIKLLFQLKKDL